MSFDNLSECKSCGAHGSVALWMQFFGSVQQAQMHGEGMEILSAFIPGPSALKVNICIGCKEIKLSLDYTAEEMEALAKRAEEQKKKNQRAVEMGKLFGGIFEKPKPGEQEKKP